MKTWMWIVGALVLGAGFIYLVGTRPADVTTTDRTSQEINIGETGSMQWDTQPEMVINTNKTYIATIETNKGVMKVELNASEAPQTVNNFVFLAREGYYEGVSFHRIIKDFMIQGGDPTGTGAGGPGYKFDDEEVQKDYLRGTIAMANSGPNTNGSQFFIMTQDNLELPKNYTIFGSINESDAESLSTLDVLAETDVELSPASGELSVPTEDVSIESVTIEEK